MRALRIIARPPTIEQFADVRVDQRRLYGVSIGGTRRSDFVEPFPRGIHEGDRPRHGRRREASATPGAELHVAMRACQQPCQQRHLVWLHLNHHHKKVDKIITERNPTGLQPSAGVASGLIAKGVMDMILSMEDNNAMYARYDKTKYKFGNSQI